jgi:hypothetical protein
MQLVRSSVRQELLAQELLKLFESSVLLEQDVKTLALVE